MHVIQELRFLNFFFFNATKLASTGSNNIPTCLSKTLAISRTPLPNWKTKQKKILSCLCSLLPSREILRWRWSHIPHFSHLHLPLCQEVTGLTLRGYSARPPRKQVNSGVWAGRGSRCRQVQVGAGHPPATPSRGRADRGHRGFAGWACGPHCTAPANTGEMERKSAFLHVRQHIRGQTRTENSTPLFHPKMAPETGVGNASRNSCRKTTKILDWAPPQKMPWWHHHVLIHRPVGNTYATQTWCFYAAELKRRALMGQLWP